MRDLSAGQLFGEVAVLYKTKRTASVRCKGQCTVGELSMEVFGELFNNFPEIHHSLVHQSRKYDDHWKKFQIDILERVDYLKGLPHVLREQMHYKLILENFE